MTIKTPQTPTTAPPAARERAHGSAAVVQVASRYGLQLFLLVFLVVLVATQPNFRSLPNIQSVLLQASFTGLAAAGMTILIVGGMFDLSVAGIVALVAVTTASLVDTVGVVLAVVLALALGTVLGILNGTIVTRLRFPAFIATYGMANVYLAVAFMITGGQVVAVSSSGLLALATATVAGLPLLFWLMAATCAVCYLLLQRTRFGRTIRAVGSSERAAVLAGLPVVRTRTAAFALVGLCTALAALGLTSLLSSANASMSLGFELNVIAVAVVGGTSLDGGRGTLFGTFTAAILFSALNNGLNLVGVASYWQYIVTGAVLVLALAFAGLRRGSRT